MPEVFMAKKQHVAKTLCGMCGRYTRCGMNVTIENGKIVSIKGMDEHIESRGFLCFRGRTALEHQYSPERLTYPVKKEGHEWRRIAWEEALNIIAERLTDVKSKYGAEALAIYLGQVVTPMMKHAKRFADLFGTPNVTSAASLCNSSRVIANVVTYGELPSPDVVNSNCILVWGANPPCSNRPLAMKIYGAQDRGAKLIVIDPRRTEIAKRADIYVPVRPASDGALALSLLNVVISENLYDKKFVDEYSIGFDKLEELVKDYSPEKVEKITWVPADTIRQIARAICNNKPTSFVDGMSLVHHTNGCQCARAIAILIAITGNLDTPGGNIFGVRVPFNSFRVKERFPTVKGVGVEKYPLFFRAIAEANATALQETLLTDKPYPIKAMLVQGGNPVSSWPNTKRTIEALSYLDFLAVMELTMTETAKLADVVLPAASFFERTSFEILPVLAVQSKVVEPMGECWPDWKFWFELGRTMGWGYYYPWKNIEEAIDFELEPAAITVQKLRDNPGGFRYGEAVRKQYEKVGFNTPSKKVEIFSKRLEDLGYDPLPVYRESVETPESRSDLVKEYPLILNTGAGVEAFHQSQYRECPSLLKRVPEPLAEINTETAKTLGIRDGDMVYIESPRGSIKVRATVTDDIHPRVVEVMHGWREANTNFLAEHSQDPVSGFPALRALLCRVSKAT